MARLFRLWGKKRGHRRTGSKLLGGLGEVLFYAALFLLGSILMVATVTVRIIHADRWGGVFTDWTFWLPVLIAAAFIVIGGIGVVYSVLQVGASRERRSSLVRRAADIELLSDTLLSPKDYPTLPRDTDITNSPGVALAYRLPIAQSPSWRFFAVAAFCLPLIALASVLVVLTIDSHQIGKPEWVLTAFTIPTAIAGVWAVYYFLNQLLMHTGIGPTSVEVSDHPLLPGRTYQVFISQAGRLKVEALELRLVCEEEATYQQGTNIRTEAKRVFEQTVLRQEDFLIDLGMPFETETQLRMPIDVMHSFKSNSNAVTWKLVVRGDVKGWPAFHRSFPLVVYPARNGKKSA